MTLMRTGRTSPHEAETAVPSLDAVTGLSVIPETNEQRASSVSRFKSDFTVNSEIGEGGFGTIFLCTNRWDGMQYAVRRERLW